MRSAVIIFPGSNCDRDIMVALEKITGSKPRAVWHRETALPEVDLIALPGGFSYGDYLRCGAIAARSEIVADVIKKAEAGVPTLGICNGFQILCEIGLLPGALMRNTGLSYLCKDVHLKVENADTPFTNAYRQGQVIRVPIAHHDGNYFVEADTAEALEQSGQIAFRYVDAAGNATPAANPNGSVDNIAGVLNPRRNVLGMMPHPERLIENALGGTDGRGVFESLMNQLAVA